MGYASDPKWYRAGLVELRRRLPDAALAQFDAQQATLVRCLDMRSRYGRLSSDLDFDYQLSLSKLEALAQNYLGLGFLQLCQRIYDWVDAAFQSTVPGYVAQPDKTVAFSMPDVDVQIEVRPGGVNAYLEELSAPVVVPDVPVAPPDVAPVEAPLDDFATLDVRILPLQAAGYPVDLVLTAPDQPDAQTFPRGYLPANIVSWWSRGAVGVDGEALFEQFTQDRTLLAAWAQALGQSPRCRIRWHIDADIAELSRIPWEVLRGNVWFAGYGDTPFSRVIPSSQFWDSVSLTLPVSGLAVVANPQDLTEKGLAPLSQDTAALFTSLSQTGHLQFDTVTSPVTLSAIERHLQQKPYAILHVVAHGAFSVRREQAALYLEDARGLTDVVVDTAFCDMLAHLKQQHRPRLVFLSACESATTGVRNPFMGLGPKLGAIGVPTVIAMQDKIAMTTALQISQVFYEQLMDHWTVDLALNEARQVLQTAQLPGTAVPVLFMRLRSGRL